MEHCCTKTAQGYEECQGNEVPFAKAKISRAHKHVNAQVQQETAQGAAEKLRYEALERDPNHQCLHEQQGDKYEIRGDASKESRQQHFILSERYF